MPSERQQRELEIEGLGVVLGALGGRGPVGESRSGCPLALPEPQKLQLTMFNADNITTYDSVIGACTRMGKRERAEKVGGRGKKEGPDTRQYHLPPRDCCLDQGGEH